MSSPDSRRQHAPTVLTINGFLRSSNRRLDLPQTRAFRHAVTYPACSSVGGGPPPSASTPSPSGMHGPGRGPAVWFCVIVTALQHAMMACTVTGSRRGLKLGVCTFAANDGVCYLCNSTGDIASLGVALHNLFHIAASMTAFVITAWVWAAFDCLLPIPAWSVAFEQACCRLQATGQECLLSPMIPIIIRTTLPS